MSTAGGSYGSSFSCVGMHCFSWMSHLGCVLVLGLLNLARLHLWADIQVLVWQFL